MSSLETCRRPVVLAYNGGIGDRLCNLPALRALASLFPHRLGLICSDGDGSTYYADLPLRCVYETTFHITETGFDFPGREVADAIGDCDLFISINPWHTAAVSDLMNAACAHSIGFFEQFKWPVPCDFVGHAIDMAFAIPTRLNPQLDLRRFAAPPNIEDTADEHGAQLLQSLGGTGPFLFFHVDSKFEKCWPLAHVERTVRAVLRYRPDVRVLLIDLNNEWSRRQCDLPQVIPVSVPLEVCFALLRRCDVFVGVDSAMLHAADLFGIPGIGLFGPTSSRRWGFRFAPHRHIEGGGHMHGVHSDKVAEAIIDFMRIIPRPRS